jgi:hypothetical protein
LAEPVSWRFGLRWPPISGPAAPAGLAAPRPATWSRSSLVDCPTLNAPSRETQTNPLLDNYEGMTIIGGPGLAEVSLISDDNFSPTQFTRVLNLAVKLP